MLMDKYRPETKQAKKERLRERAAARFILEAKFLMDMAKSTKETVLDE